MDGNDVGSGVDSLSVAFYSRVDKVLSPLLRRSCRPFSISFNWVALHRDIENGMRGA